jgi:chaperonin cofactor prefoldin
MTSGMTTRRPPRTPQVDPVRAALERLAQAQEATQAELHDLIVHVRHLTEAQRRTEERLEQLAARVDQLAEAQRRTEERLEQLTARVDALAVRVDALAVRVDALAVRVDQLAEAQRRTEEELARLTAQVTALTARVGRMDGQLGNLLGRELERSYRELAHAYFADILASIHVVSRDDLAHLLDTAVDAGAITQDERRDVLFADLVLQGVRPSDRQRSYLVAEISASISDVDAQRAVRRAALLQRATGLPTLPAVGGERIHENADATSRAFGVWRVLDGIVLGPSDPAPADRIITVQA